MLEAVVFGGEALEPQRLGAWLDSHPDLPRLVNMYGITETTVHASFREILAGDVDIAGSPIGVPLAHLGFFVLDNSLQPVPAGGGGGVVVGGAGGGPGDVGCGRRVVCSRRWGGLWVCGPGRVDRIPVCGMPVRRTWRPHVPHRGSGVLG